MTSGKLWLKLGDVVDQGPQTNSDLPEDTAPDNSVSIPVDDLDDELEFK